MGRISVINQEQETILSLVKQTAYIREKYYFTGGTALALHYLQHRESVDLDFFNDQPVDVGIITSILELWRKDIPFNLTTEFYEVVLRCNLTFPNNTALLVDFAHYPCHRVEDGANIDGLEVDSILDIAVNKLKCVSDRTNVKDFVDLYFLLTEKNVSLWDLVEGVKVKFRTKIDPYILGTDFYKVNDFETLPNMIKPLELQTLKDFFNDHAKTLGSMSVE